MLISTLRNAVLCDALSVRSIIIWHLSTAEMELDVTSALVLIALMTVYSVIVRWEICHNLLQGFNLHLVSQTL